MDFVKFRLTRDVACIAAKMYRDAAPCFDDTMPALTDVTRPIIGVQWTYPNEAATAAKYEELYRFLKENTPWRVDYPAEKSCVFHAVSCDDAMELWFALDEVGKLDYVAEEPTAPLADNELELRGCSMQDLTELMNAQTRCR